MARQALGKGLKALIMKKGDDAASLPAPSDSADQVLTVGVDELTTCPFQPRRHFDSEQISELAESIKERGLLQPLVVRLVEGQYELIAGERRLRAARSLGMTKIRVIVHEATDLEVAELTLIENLQREDLRPLEEAEQYKMLQKRFGLKQGDIARHVGKARTVVANMIRLLDLEEEVRAMLNNQDITIGHAKVLLQLKEADVQITAAQRVHDRKLTVRQTEQLVRDLLDPPERPAKEATPVPPIFDTVCKKLTADLGTPVHISMKGENKGTIEIPYLSKSEFTRIIQLFGITENHE